jgi:AcrR family transcriptional regulator
MFQAGQRCILYCVEAGGIGGRPYESMTESKTRGRQRSAESEEAILTATLQLLKEKPLREITIEAIARKAGVGKMTIYKWWPSKAYVALDAFRKTINKMIVIPDTGDTERDLAELLRSSMASYTTATGRIFGQFLAECQTDPEFAALFRERFMKPRREATREILNRAVKRGEIDQKLDQEAIIDLIFGPMVFRLMAGHGPLNKTEADAMISILLRGIGCRPTLTKRASRPKPRLTGSISSQVGI